MQDLSGINWDLLLQEDDIDKNFSTFFNKVNKLTNRYAPLRTLSKRKSKQLCKPWITKGIKKSIKVKNQFFIPEIESAFDFIEIKSCNLLELARKIIITIILSQILAILGKPGKV